MSNIIPYPRIGRCQSIDNPVIVTITHGDFVKAVQFIWDKFNFRNGINLAAFRHNLRDYYDETAPITQYELQTIRGLLSDPEMQICVSPVGNGFRWDNRNSSGERKCIFIDEALFFLFSSHQTEIQDHALRLIFMGTLLHCLGDYITTWAQPAIDFSTKPNKHRAEGGTKTEYAFFGGIIGGNMGDGFHYDYAKIRVFNPMNQPESWFISDKVAQEYYSSDQILKFGETGLTKNPAPMGPTNTIRQLDICCGWHRSVWKPIHRPPPEQPQPPPQQGGFNPHGYFGQPPPTASHWYPSQPQPHQGGYVSYGAPPGGTYDPPAYPPGVGNYAGGYPSGPPPLGISTDFVLLTIGNQQFSWPDTYNQDPSASWNPIAQESHPPN